MLILAKNTASKSHFSASEQVTQTDTDTSNTKTRVENVKSKIISLYIYTLCISKYALMEVDSKDVEVKRHRDAAVSTSCGNGIKMQ